MSNYGHVWLFDIVVAFIFDLMSCVCLRLNPKIKYNTFISALYSSSKFILHVTWYGWFTNWNQAKMCVCVRKWERTKRINASIVCTKLPVKMCKRSHYVLKTKSILKTPRKKWKIIVPHVLTHQHRLYTELFKVEHASWRWIEIHNTRTCMSFEEIKKYNLFIDNATIRLSYQPCVLIQNDKNRSAFLLYDFCSSFHFISSFCCCSLFVILPNDSVREKNHNLCLLHLNTERNKEMILSIAHQNE